MIHTGMKNLKHLAVCAALLCGVAIYVHAQIPAQYNSFNSVTGAATTATASVTITGVASTRVRIYSITAVCNTGGTNTVPTITVTDAGNTILSYPNQSISTEAPPIHPYHWNPGLTASVGGTVVVSANIGAACGGGTTLTVQADQF